MYRALKWPFVAEWADRHHEHLALRLLCEPAPLAGSLPCCLLTSGWGQMQDAHFPNRAHRASNTCIFRSCFSLIVSQPLICHPPDGYKLKHHSEVWRQSISHHHLWLSEPRSRSGWSRDLSLQSNQGAPASKERCSLVASSSGE